MSAYTRSIAADILADHGITLDDLLEEPRGYGGETYIEVDADLYEGVTFVIGPLSEWEANIIVFEIGNKGGIPVRKVIIRK